MSHASQDMNIPVPSSEENPPINNYSFYLKMRHLHKLKLAIEAMADPTFNDHGFGTVRVAADGFTLSSITKDSHCNAFLQLNPPLMCEFKSCAPIAGTIPLDLLSHSFPHDPHEEVVNDTVSIFHLLGSNRLCFEFGSLFGVCAEIVTFPSLTWFPSFTAYCGTPLPVADLREMIDYTLQAQGRLSNKTVVVKMKRDFATFEIGNDKKWEYDYRQFAATAVGGRGRWGLKEGEMYDSAFNWSYTRMLKMASFLTPDFAIFFLTNPKKHVLFVFRMKELGHFFVIKKALLVVLNLQTSTPDRRMQSEDLVSKSLRLDTLTISGNESTQQ